MVVFYSKTSNNPCLFLFFGILYVSETVSPTEKLLRLPANCPFSAPVISGPGKLSPPPRRDRFPGSMIYL